MKTTTAYFNRFLLEIPVDAIADCSHQGRCDDDVAHWSKRVERPTECSPENLAAELKEYGTWDSDELADDDENWNRIVWIACCDLKEESHD